MSAAAERIPPARCVTVPAVTAAKLKRNGTGSATPTEAQSQTFRRLHDSMPELGATFSHLLTVDGLAVIYLLKDGQRRPLYLDQEGYPVTRRGSAWERFAAPFQPQQLTLGV